MTPRRMRLLRVPVPYIFSMFPYSECTLPCIHNPFQLLETIFEVYAICEMRNAGYLRNPDRIKASAVAS